MKIKWLGHASFLITSDSGVRVVTDPYHTGTGTKLSYGVVKETADVVTVSHNHGDHNDTANVQGNPKIVNRAGITEAKGIRFQGMPAYHDEEKGKARGDDIIFCFEMDGMRLCHMGDLGHQLNDQQVSEIGKVDVLFIPVGGLYTIDAKGAGQVISRIAPKVVFPMHYKTEKCGYPIAGVDDFIKGKRNVTRMDTSEVELRAKSLPASTQIMVLKPAL